MYLIVSRRNEEQYCQHSALSNEQICAAANSEIEIIDISENPPFRIFACWDDDLETGEPSVEWTRVPVIN